MSFFGGLLYVSEETAVCIIIPWPVSYTHLGETFKELKAADYIPVGATLNVDGIKCRIEAVDFAADEVRLTNIEDKNRPIRFSESIQYVRSYVEDAGTAIYDTIPKKPAARESIRDKLKSAQKAQPPHTTKPQKNKGKDMEL